MPVDWDFWILLGLFVYALHRLGKASRKLQQYDQETSARFSQVVRNLQAALDKHGLVLVTVDKQGNRKLVQSATVTMAELAETYTEANGTSKPAEKAPDDPELKRRMDAWEQLQ